MKRKTRIYSKRMGIRRLRLFLRLAKAGLNPAEIEAEFTATAQAWRGVAGRGRPKRAAVAAFRELAEAIVTAEPAISAPAAFELIPDAAEAGNEPNTDCGFLVYRDGERIVAVDDASDADCSISYRRWRDYISEASPLQSGGARIAAAKNAKKARPE